MTLHLLCALLLLGSGNESPADAAGQIKSLYEQEKFTAVIAMAGSVADPSPDVLFFHGLSLARTGQFDSARTVLERGWRLAPSDARFPLELAGVAFRQKQPRSSKALLRDALRLDPENRYGNDFLGSLYLLDDNLPAALKYWGHIGKPLVQDVLFDPVPDVHRLLLQRAVTISGGQIFTLRRLRATEANLDRLDIFARRRVELQGRNDGRFDATLRLLTVSQPLAGWLGKVLPVVRGLPYQALHFDRYNMGERGINMRALGRWDHNKRRVAVELSAPIGLNPGRRYRLYIDGRDENWDLSRTYRNPDGTGHTEGLHLRKGTAGGDLVFTLGDRLTWTTGLSMTHRSYRDLGALASAGLDLFAEGWSFDQRNQFDYPFLDLPEHRLRGDATVLLRTGRVSSQRPLRYASLEADARFLWLPQAKDDLWTVETRVRAGGTAGTLPFDGLFQLGMERDNDLWLRGVVGTRDGRKGNAPLGQNYLLSQTGFDRTMARMALVQVKAGPFFDSGWIAGPDSRFGSHGWLPGTGVQAKVVVGGGFTWTVVLGRDLRRGDTTFYTSVGR